MITLRAGIQQVPPDDQGGHDLETGEIVVEDTSFEAARDEAYARVEREHPGWRVIHLTVTRPEAAGRS